MPDELTECRRKIAQYQGAISRWCGLTGNSVNATKHKHVAEEELNRFRENLDRISVAKIPSKNSQLQGCASEQHEGESAWNF